VRIEHVDGVVVTGEESLTTSGIVKTRYLGDPLAPVRRRPAVGRLASSVDPVGFAAGVGEGPVGFDRIVFCGVDS